MNSLVHFCAPFFRQYFFGGWKNDAIPWNHNVDNEIVWCSVRAYLCFRVSTFGFHSSCQYDTGEQEKWWHSKVKIMIIFSMKLFVRCLYLFVLRVSDMHLFHAVATRSQSWFATIPDLPSIRTCYQSRFAINRDLLSVTACGFLVFKMTHYKFMRIYY